MRPVFSAMKPSSSGSAACAPVKVQTVAKTAASRRITRAQAAVLGRFTMRLMRSLRPLLPQFMVVAVRRSEGRLPQVMPMSVRP